MASTLKSSKMPAVHESFPCKAKAIDKENEHFHSPISSIRGAIRKVTPTNRRHINNKRNAVAMIVHLARFDSSSGSIT